MRNRMFLAVDLIGWVLIPTLALALRLDGFGRFSAYAGHLLLFTAIVVICKFVAFWALGLYRRYWLYASIDELILIAKYDLHPEQTKPREVDYPDQLIFEAILERHHHTWQ